jgi:hypothetical protein
MCLNLESPALGRMGKLVSTALQVVKCIHGSRPRGGAGPHFPRLRDGDACGIVELALALDRFIVH